MHDFGGKINRPSANTCLLAVWRSGLVTAHNRTCMSSNGPGRVPYEWGAANWIAPVRPLRRWSPPPAYPQRRQDPKALASCLKWWCEFSVPAPYQCPSLPSTLANCSPTPSPFNECIGLGVRLAQGVSRAAERRGRFSSTNRRARKLLNVATLSRASSQVGRKPSLTVIRQWRIAMTWLSLRLRYSRVK